MRMKIRQPFSPAVLRGLSALALAGFLAGALAGCATTDPPGGRANEPPDASPPTGYVRDLPPEEFRNFVEGRADVFVIDLRTDGEWRTDPGPFPQAVRIPVERLESRRGELPQDHDRPVAVYDRTGLRSVGAARWLVGQGYREVATLLGGLDAWIRAGL
jgi:rhodanese-related sulfurtransferase